MVQGQQRNNLTGRLVVRFWQIQYSALMKEWARVVLMHRDESASKPCTVRRCVLSTSLLVDVLLHQWTSFLGFSDVLLS